MQEQACRRSCDVAIVFQESLQAMNKLGLVCGIIADKRGKRLLVEVAERAVVPGAHQEGLETYVCERDNGGNTWRRPCQARCLKRLAT